MAAPPSGRAGRAARFAALLLLAWAVASFALPAGLPFGVVLLGVVLGSLTALTAMGLVLVHRASRIVNFAQAEIGGLSASIAVVMVVGFGLPYFAALPVGLAAAVATGALVELLVVRRFFDSPRLILTVATIGLAQLLAGLEIALPHFVGHIRPLTTFTTPFHASLTVGPIVFNGDHLVAVCVVPVAVALLGWFLIRSDAGIAIRAAAESGERALLLGIPIRRLSTLAWVVAAVLSGVASMLAAPILGPSLGALAGPEMLLAPLTAAVVARMESLPVAFGASLAIGVFQQAVFWSYPRSSYVDIGLFVLILLALLVRRRGEARVDDVDLAGHVAVREVRPVPVGLSSLRVVRRARRIGAVALGALVVFGPAALSTPRQGLVAYMAIYGIVAVSLVVLTGWAGQLSLGQFAFVGLGAGVTGALVVHTGVDLFVALVASSFAGALAAVLIGLPALRIRGLLLAVTTLAFAVPVSTYLLNSAYVPWLAPPDVGRPAVFQRFDLNAPLTFYWFCLCGLAFALVVARNFRRSRAGRVVLAVRDNERAAAAFSVSPVRAKLTAFAVSGALAGFAGGLYVIAARGIGFSGFSPVTSLEVFTMVVVGGLASLPGALLGAVYVQSVEFFLHGAAQLLATGAGLLFLLMVVPGGLGEVLYGARDWLLRRLARSRGLDVPGFTSAAAASGSDDGSRSGDRPVPGRPITRSREGSAGAVLACDGIDTGYGKMQVLFRAGFDVEAGEAVALLGTNGAGKSTLLRVAAGVLPAWQGRVVLGGDDVTSLDPVERLRRGLVTVPGGRGVFGSLTVADNLRLAGWLRRRHDRAALATDVARVLELFPILRERLAERASSLSGGEQQMLTLGQALLCRPKVLLVDELSLGLAPAVVARLLEVVRDLAADGVAVVLVEQSLNVAAAATGRAVFLEKGEIRFAGPTAELTERGDVARAVFLRPGDAPARTRRRPAASSNGAAARLEVVGLGRRFGGISAIDDVDLDVRAGRILGVIGANGAGKTTLFDLCSGFVTPNAGRIRLDGVDVTSWSAAGRAEAGLGRSFQDARLFPSMTVAEAVAVAFERHVDVRDPVACIARVGATIDSEDDVRRKVGALLDRTGLTGFRDVFVSELSTGTRRIVDLACAVAHDPRVLLLDEPSSGVAQRESEALGQLLLRLRDETGMAMIVIEHDIPLVSSIADELVCLHLGRVIARGTPRSVLKDPAVVAAYLGTDPAAIRRSGRSTVRAPELTAVSGSNPA
jgi:ABC-type branched-subunit amino acid transport system ATPase component/ABC-type branched-subunit amino acid transport system permease subunit